VSADNWALCPKCYSEQQAKRAKRIKEYENAYGKVPPSQWLKLKEAADVEVTGKETLREDYEVGIDSDGHFSVSYTGECDCGFSFTYTHGEKAIKEVRS
jgi:hypothetical protein